MSVATPIAGSRPVRNAMLDLFSIPSTDVSLLNRKLIPIQPFTTGINPVDIRVEAQSGYCDLSRSHFEIELELKKADGTDLDAYATSTLLPTNQMCHTMIKQFNVSLGDTLISPQTDTYPYQAFFEKVMHYDPEDGKTLLKQEGWINGLDIPLTLTANQMDAAGPHTNYTALPQKHKDYISDYRKELGTIRAVKKTYIFKPHNDVFNMSKLLVPQVPMTFRIAFHNPSFL